MVIMIKLAGLNGRGRWCAILLLALPAGGARSAEWTVTPALSSRASYSDNLLLAPPGQARGEWTSELSPGIAVTARGPRLTLQLDYTLQQIDYSREPDRRNQQLDAATHATLVDDWLYLDARAAITQQNISAFGPQLSAPNQITGNSDTVHSSTIAPLLRHYFRGLATLQLRYADDKVGSGRLLSVRSRDSNVELTGDNGGRGWNWDLSADRQDTDDAALAPVTLTNGALTLSFPVNSALAYIAVAGAEKNDYHSVGANPQGRYWSLGLNWTPSPRTSVALSVGHHYYGNTQNLNAQYRLRAMFWQLSYADTISTTQAQILALAPNEVGNFLYQLWAASIPDASQRIQTINAFLQLSKLLGPNAGNVNYFSHQYYLQKQWNLATVYSSPKSSFALGFTSSGRTAQTSSGIDSILLGPSQVGLDDRTRQNTANAGWSWRMAPRSTLSLTASVGNVTSISTGRRDRNDVLSLSLSRVLRPQVNALVELHHSRHDSNAGGDYRENGASAALVVQF